MATVRHRLHFGSDGPGIALKWWIVLRSGDLCRKVGVMKDFVLFGEYEHSIDDKGRVILPARFREHFSQRAYLALHVEEGAACATVFAEDAWQEYVDRKIKPREESGLPADNRIIRDIYRDFDMTEPDRQGRVLLPSKFVQKLALRGKVIILGRRDRLEIWNPETLARYDAEGKPDHAS
jgi:MraZ protein